MKLNSEKEADASKGAMLLLAYTNDHMILIREILAENSAIATATRGCDVRRYRESCVFEAYVEAETYAGAMFSWLLDITLTSTGWTFTRRVAEQTKDGEQVEVEFDDFSSPDLGDLAGSYLDLMTGFEEAAKNFDFNNRASTRGTG
jgi:hypothetical protein